MNRPALTAVLALVVALTACGSETAPGDQPAATFRVVLVHAGEQPITALKAVQEVTGLGLQEARALVNAVPTVLKEALTAGEAKAIAKRLEQVGMKAEVQPR